MLLFLLTLCFVSGSFFALGATWRKLFAGTASTNFGGRAHCYHMKKGSAAMYTIHNRASFFVNDFAFITLKAITLINYVDK